MNKYIPLALSASLLLAGCGPRLEPTQADIQNALNMQPTPEQKLNLSDTQIIDYCGGPLAFDTDDPNHVLVLALDDTKEATKNSSGVGVTCVQQQTNLEEICPNDPSATIAGYDAENGVVNIKGDCNGDGIVENTNLMGDPENTKAGQPVQLVKPWYEN